MNHQRGCETIGIDLGTTYSAMAYLDAEGTPRIINDANGNALTPSVIGFDDGNPVVGQLAVEQARHNAEQTVQFIKVHVGDQWRRDIGGHIHTPESLSALILRHMIQHAERDIGPIHRAVITVPAYFTERRRRATQQAGEIAGLEVAATLNEPMAATLAYGLHRQSSQQRVMVFDLGGGTFDVTVVCISPDEIMELATGGNRKLGGRDWDETLMDYVADQFNKQFGFDLRSDAQTWQNLRVECERAKRQFSGFKQTTLQARGGGHELAMQLTRDEFESMTAHLVQMTKLTADLVLEDAGVAWNQLNRVLLVGGSTQSLAIRNMLEDAFGYPPDTGVNPSTAVALGAALYGRILESGDKLESVNANRETPNQGPPPLPVELVESVDDDSEIAIPVDDDSEIAIPIDDDESQLIPLDQASPPAAESDTPALEANTPAADGNATEAFHPTSAPSVFALPEVRFVTAHGVGVRVRGDDGWRNAVLIAKNSDVPASVSRRFVTTRTSSGGNTLKIDITQGDTEDIESAETLGSGRIVGIPELEPAGQPVDVFMSFDAQGRLHVTATYGNTGQNIELELDIPGGLKEEEIKTHQKYVAQSRLLSVFDPDQALAGLDDELDD